jgi:RHS repeat-associated protein
MPSRLARSPDEFCRADYSFLPGGRLSSLVAPGGASLSYVYDGPLLMSVTSSGPATALLELRYDSRLFVDRLTLSGQVLDFGYDNDGLLTSASHGGASLGLTRDANTGRLMGGTLGQMADSFSYNGFGEPLSYAATHGGSPRFAASYTRDGLGRIDTRSEASQGDSWSEGYGYDAAGRLETVTRGGQPASTYEFDSNGGRERHRIGLGSALRGRSWPCLGLLDHPGEIVIVGEYDAQDRMGAYGTCAYTYGANGELATRTDTATAQVTTYRYDVFTNLRQVDLPDGREIVYAIDGQNRRVGKSIDGVAVQAFVYQDQLNPIAEYDGSGALVSVFVYAERGHVPSFLRKGGNTYRIVADHLGSVRQVIDVATGVVVQRLDYDEYGVVLTDSNPGFQPFAYAGGIYDQDTGLVRFGARDYDAISGRWTAKDPIGFGGEQENLYVYALIDPLNHIDPSGEIAFVPILIGFAIGAGLEALTNPCASLGDMLLAGAIGSIGGGASKAIFLRHGPKSLTRNTGLEWSHGISRSTVNRHTSGSLNRALNQRGGYNGSWRTPQSHARHDPSRHVPGVDPMPAPLRALDRVPDWLKGTSAAGGLGVAVAGDSDCECR